MPPAVIAGLTRNPIGFAERLYALQSFGFLDGIAGQARNDGGDCAFRRYFSRLQAALPLDLEMRLTYG